MPVPPEYPAEDGKIKHPDYDPTPIITLPDNITVRAYKTSDAANIARHGNNKIIASRMRNRYPDPYTIAHAENWINMANDPSTFVKPGPFDPATLEGTLPAIPMKYCICWNDAAIGGIGGQFGSDIDCRNVEFGYWVGEQFWGKGVMSVLVPAFVAWLWRSFDRIVRIEGCVFEGNPASCRLLEKAGLRYVRRADKAVYKYGRLLGLDMFEAVRENVD